MKIALVTGAGIRIGKGIAECLLKEGFKLILHAHSSIKELQEWTMLDPLRNQILATINADISSEEGQDILCSETLKHTNSLDLIVHNASIFYPQNYVGMTREAYREMQAINLEAPYFITQNLLPALQKSSSPCVINILDALWERPHPRFSHYSVSKAGLAILTKSLARELAPSIRVNAVAPGAILFQSFHDEATQRDTLNKIPLKKLGSVEDIGDAVIYLAKSPYITGEILIVDGGRSLA